MTKKRHAERVSIRLENAYGLLPNGTPCPPGCPGAPPPLVPLPTRLISHRRGPELNVFDVIQRKLLTPHNPGWLFPHWRYQRPDIWDHT